MTREAHTIRITLMVWRQEGPKDRGRFETIDVPGVETHMSFLEMLDVVNERLAAEGKIPIEFDNDCREGICGMCGAVINGIPHGPNRGATLCQLHMRTFRDGDTVVVEPWRAKAFRLVKDLIVDRSALDRIMEAGGYISVNAGSAPDANTLPVSQDRSDLAMDAAACIGCGACVAACPNASAMLFVGAKVSHLAMLPQGRVEAARRVLHMQRAMDTLGFGNCSNERECEAACPKEIKITNIARLNREFIKAGFGDGET